LWIFRRRGSIAIAGIMTESQ